MEELGYLAAARFSGTEASDFLQNQLSADVGALEVGEATFACYCSPRGQVYGLLLLMRTSGEYLVAGSAELLPRILERLRMFVFRSKVEFSLVEDLAVFGATAEQCNPEDCYSPAATPGLNYALAPAGSGNPAAKSGFRRAELASGVCWLSDRSSEKFIPQMLGFDQIGAVSFTKGCYPGQEIVARARYLGKVKRGPHVCAVEQAPAADVAERVEIKKGGRWLSGILVDSVPGDPEPSVLFVVAPTEPEGPVEAFRYQERDYGCATM